PGGAERREQLGLGTRLGHLLDQVRVAGAGALEGLVVGVLAIVGERLDVPGRVWEVLDPAGEPERLGALDEDVEAGGGEAREHARDPRGARHSARARAP